MEYLSLYDYLGHKAGEELGKAVAIVAIQHKIPIKTREISNPAFTGKVNLYPKDFLDFYFRKPISETIEENLYDGDTDELPF